MTTVQKMFRICAFFLFAAAGMATNASAVVVWGTFTSGHATIGLNVSTASTVEFLFLSGYGDATFSLFDAAGSHLITNDDSAGFNPHLTRNLAAGNYSLLVSYCCNSYFYANDLGAAFTSTDGFNSGTYVVGGTATLAGMEAAVDSGDLSGFTYSFSMTNATVGASAVPEPGSIALLGLGLAGLAATRKRKQA